MIDLNGTFSGYIVYVNRFTKCQFTLIGSRAVTNSISPQKKLIEYHFSVIYVNAKANKTVKPARFGC